jgi:hypothetical protein
MPTGYTSRSAGCPPLHKPAAAEKSRGAQSLQSIGARPGPVRAFPLEKPAQTRAARGPLASQPVRPVGRRCRRGRHGTHICIYPPHRAGGQPDRNLIRVERAPRAGKCPAPSRSQDSIAGTSNVHEYTASTTTARLVPSRPSRSRFPRRRCRRRKARRRETLRGSAVTSFSVPGARLSRLLKRDSAAVIMQRRREIGRSICRADGRS